MFDFDLNQSHYTVPELLELFSLPATSYGRDDVERQTEQLIQNIRSDKNVNDEIKQRTILFVREAKNRIIASPIPQPYLSTNNGSSLVGGSVSANNSSLANTYKNIYNLDQGQLVTNQTQQAGSTTLIQRPATPYAQSMPSEFYPGTINPLEKRVLLQTVNIDTRFRDNYYATTASNFHLNLPMRLTEVVSMQLSAIEFPASFYAISKTFSNNYFLISKPDVAEPLLVTVPDGNYTATALVTWLNGFLAATTDFSTIQFATDEITERMIVGSTDGTTEFSLLFATDKTGVDDRNQPLPLKLGWIMGFRGGLYENSFTYLSEGLIDLSGPRYLYLSVNDYATNVNEGFYAAFTNSFINKNILARITLQGTPHQFISQNNLSLITNPRLYFGPVDIMKLQVQLLDEYGRPINLNNMDYSFCLSFKTAYNL